MTCTREGPAKILLSEKIQKPDKDEAHQSEICEGAKSGQGENNYCLRLSVRMARHLKFLKIPITIRKTNNNNAKTIFL